MPLIIQIFPQCDVCLETNPDALIHTVRYKVIEDLKREGWRVRRKHLTCPDCLRKRAKQEADNRFRFDRACEIVQAAKQSKNESEV